MRDADGNSRFCVGSHALSAWDLLFMSSAGCGPVRRMGRPPCDGPFLVPRLGPSTSLASCTMSCQGFLVVHLLPIAPPGCQHAARGQRRRWAKTGNLASVDTHARTPHTHTHSLSLRGWSCWAVTPFRSSSSHRLSLPVGFRWSSTHSLAGPVSRAQVALAGEHGGEGEDRISTCQVAGGRKEKSQYSVVLRRGWTKKRKEKNYPNKIARPVPLARSASKSDEWVDNWAVAAWVGRSAGREVRLFRPSFVWAMQGRCTDAPTHLQQWASATFVRPHVLTPFPVREGGAEAGRRARQKDDRTRDDQSLRGSLGVSAIQFTVPPVDARYT